MTSVIWALLSSVAYGLSDFVGGAASRRAPALQVVLLSYPVSAVLMALLAFLVPATPTMSSLLWGAASGAVMCLAMWSFYAALAMGPMSLVSPLTALFVTVIPATTGILLGERPSILALIGMTAAAIAVVLVSQEPNSRKGSHTPVTRQAIGATVVAGVAFSLSFIFTGQIATGTGLWPLLAGRTTATILILTIALILRKIGAPQGIALIGAVSVGALDVVANTSMLFAFQNGPLSLGSAIIALYPAVTVALAMATLGERVTAQQGVGLCLAALAVTTIGLNS